MKDGNTHGESSEDNKPGRLPSRGILSALFRYLNAAAPESRCLCCRHSQYPISFILGLYHREQKPTDTELLPFPSGQVLEKTPSTVMDKPLGINTANVYVFVLYFTIGSHLFVFDGIGARNNRKWPPHFHGSVELYAHAWQELQQLYHPLEGIENLL